jgi:hypothetical protein
VTVVPVSDVDRAKGFTDIEAARTELADPPELSCPTPTQRVLGRTAAGGPQAIEISAAV